MSKNKVRLKIRRQDGPDKPNTRRWDVFEVPRLPRMSVVDALRYIQAEPVTVDGNRVAPVSWDCSCLEETCGACTMLIQGVAQQACGVLLDDIAPKGKLVVIEPLSKFPVVRDLVVDRTRMVADLVRLKAWIEIDGVFDTGEGLRENADHQRARYALSRCMMCGCCVEACPNVNDASVFVGAAAINQVRLINMRPSDDGHRVERLDGMMRRGGVAECGKAQLCAEVCPQLIPLTESIGHVARDTTKRLVSGWILGS